MAKETIEAPQKNQDEVVESYGDIDQKDGEVLDTVSVESAAPISEGGVEPMSADYDSEAIAADIQKKKTEQQIFEERQAARKREVERSFMSRYEQEKERILLEKRNNGYEEVLDEEDIEKLIKFQGSVTDRTEIEKERMLFEKRGRGEVGELSKEEQEKLHEFHAAFKKLQTSSKGRQNDEIAKQLATGVASLPASLVGIRSFYSLPTYFKQRFGVRGFLGKGGMEESIEKVMAASQQTHQRIQAEEPETKEMKVEESEEAIVGGVQSEQKTEGAEVEIEASEKKDKGILGKFFSKFKIFNKQEEPKEPQPKSQKHTETRESITELNKKLKMTREGSVRDSKQRKLIAKMLWENRQREINSGEQRHQEISNILDNYTTTKVKGVEAVRDTVDSALVGIAATGVGIPVALSVRVANTSLMDVVGRYQEQKKLAKRQSRDLKIIKDVVVGGIVENCKEMLMMDVKDEDGRSKTGFQKKAAFVGAWGRVLRTGALGALAYNPEVFTNIIEGTGKALQEGRMTMEQAMDNVKDVITYQAERYAHLAEKTGEYLTAGLEKGGAAISGVFESDLMGADLKGNVDLSHLGAVSAQPGVSTHHVVERIPNSNEQTVQDTNAPKPVSGVEQPKGPIPASTETHIDKQAIELENRKIADEINKEMKAFMAEKNPAAKATLAKDLAAKIHSAEGKIILPRENLPKEIKTELGHLPPTEQVKGQAAVGATAEKVEKPVDIKTINEHLKAYAAEKNPVVKTELAQRIAQEMWQSDMTVGKGSAPEVMAALQEIHKGFTADQTHLASMVAALTKTDNPDERIKILEDIATKQQHWQGKLQIDDNIGNQLNQLYEIKRVAGEIAIQETANPIGDTERAELASDLEKIKADLTRLAFTENSDEKNKLLAEINSIRGQWGEQINFPQDASDQLDAAALTAHGLHDDFTIEFGKNGVPAESERVLSAIVADRMNLDGKLDEQQASIILNIAGNIEKNSGHFKEVFELGHGKLIIHDHEKFNTLVDEYQAHAQELWDKGDIMQGKGGAAGYLDKIKQGTWLKILHADSLQEHIPGHQEMQESDITDFKHSKIVHDAKILHHQLGHSKGESISENLGKGKSGKALGFEIISDEAAVVHSPEVTAGQEDALGKIPDRDHIFSDYHHRMRGEYIMMPKADIEKYYDDMSYDDLGKPGLSYIQHEASHLGMQETDNRLGLVEKYIEGKLVGTIKDMSEIKGSDGETFGMPKPGEQIGHYFDRWSGFAHKGIPGPKEIDANSATAVSAFHLKVGGRQFDLPQGAIAKSEGGKLSLDFAISATNHHKLDGDIIKGAGGQIMFQGNCDGHKMLRNLELLLDEMKIQKEDRYFYQIGSGNLGDIIVGEKISGPSPIFHFNADKNVYESVNYPGSYPDGIKYSDFEVYINKFPHRTIGENVQGANNHGESITGSRHGSRSDQELPVRKSGKTPGLSKISRVGRIPK